MSAGHALWARALDHRAQSLLLKKQRGQDSNGPQVPQPAPPALNRGQVPQKAAQGDRLSEPRDAGPWGGGALTPVLKQLQASSAPSQSWVIILKVSKMFILVIIKFNLSQ